GLEKPLAKPRPKPGRHVRTAVLTLVSGPTYCAGVPVPWRVDVAVIRLEGLSLFGHHGANAAEREAGTRLDVDVDLELDTAAAEQTDRLRHTVNYDEIFALVRDRVENDSFHLL